jgi:hypothetical protein
MVGIDRFDARNYHLCIDSSVVGFPACVEMIKKLVSIKERRNSFARPEINTCFSNHQFNLKRRLLTGKPLFSPHKD